MRARLKSDVTGGWGLAGVQRFAFSVRRSAFIVDKIFSALSYSDPAPLNCKRRTLNAMGKHPPTPNPSSNPQ